MASRRKSDKNFVNVVDRVIKIKGNKSDSTDLEFSRKFGEITVKCGLNSFKEFEEYQGDYELCVKFGEFDRVLCATGSVEKCCDEMMTLVDEKITEYQKKIDELNEVQRFLAGSMLGNGDMVKKMDKLTDAVPSTVKGKR